MRRTLRARAALAVLALTLAAAACGDEGGTGGGGWITDLLGRVPDTRTGTEDYTSANDVYVTNIAAAAGIAGVEVPGEGASGEEINDYLDSLPLDVVFPDVMRRTLGNFDDLSRELGIGWTDVEAAIQTAFLPRPYQVLVGDFDAAAIDEAVHADPDWSGLLTTVEYGEVAYYTWGEDNPCSLADATPVRPGGCGGLLALDGRYLYWVDTTAFMQGLIDAAADAVPSLADDPALARVARALEDAGVYSAVLTALPFPRQRLETDSGLALGLGGGSDDDGPLWVVVAVHDGAEAAEESAAAMRSILAEGTNRDGELWSERISAFEVTVEGDMLVASVRPSAGVGDWGDWLAAYSYSEELALAAGR